MSIEALNWAFDLELTTPQKMVTIMLANYANEDAKAWPSLETLAKKTRLSRRSVIQQIAKLEEIGVVKKVGNTQMGVNIYQLNIHTKFIENTSEPDSPPSERRAPLLVNDVHLPSERRSPNPSYNHHINLVSKKNLKCTLPENFTVTDSHRNFAKANGLPNPDKELEHFKDHHLTNGSKFIDWNAAFRNWLRRSQQFNKTPAYQSHKAEIKSTVPDFVPEQRKPINREEGQQQFKKIKQILPKH
jgi:DNA-binding Lrp family transcriptional regulator